MLARVTIASNALALEGVSLPAANFIHRALLEQINTHARLVFGGDAEVLALIRAIRSPGIPQDARTRWMATIDHLHKHQRIRVLPNHGTPLSSVVALDELRASWGPDTDLAIVAEAACSALGIPAEVGLLDDPRTSPVVATSVAATGSRAMSRLKELTEHPVAQHGSAREEFWCSVLEPLAVDARSATILDGYLFNALWDISARKPWARGWRGEQLAWLLDHLDAVMAPDAEIHLIGNRDSHYPDMDAALTASALRTAWRPASTGRLRRVTLELAQPLRGERFPHDRHIRFSSGGAVGIGAGFDRLRDSRIWDPDGMRWTYLWHSEALRVLEDSEERGAALAHGSHAMVLDR